MNESQYNIGVGKYKILSSSAGVGSVVSTKWGGFVMPLSISKWSALARLSKLIDENDSLAPSKQLSIVEIVARDPICSLVDDQRFIKYLQKKEDLTDLRALVAIPHLQINESDYCVYENHPIYKKWLSKNPNINIDRRIPTFSSFNWLVIPGVVFPRWFKSNKKGNYLKKIDQWEADWNKLKGIDNKFVLPVEAIFNQNGRVATYEVRGSNNRNYTYAKSIPLDQVQMVLICPKGHISDIPWDKYFAFKVQAQKSGTHLTGADYKDLFRVDPCTCCNNEAHELQWITNRDNPESYGTLMCRKCGEKVSLEGIMNIRPNCKGEKPWAGDPQTDRNANEHCDEQMRWALVTSNSMYYADTFKSLFIPMGLLDLKPEIDDKLKPVLGKLKLLYDGWPEKAVDNKDFFIDYYFYNVLKNVIEDINYSEDPEDRIDENVVLRDASLIVDSLITSVDCSTRILRKVSRKLTRKIMNVEPARKIQLLSIMDCAEEDGLELTVAEAEIIFEYFEMPDEEEMTEEKYRFDEFKVFESHDDYKGNNRLTFTEVNKDDIESDIISEKLSKIKQVHRLTISSTQLGFSRAEMPEPQRQGNTIVWPDKQKIYDTAAGEVKVLPANENYGEGLFFSFNETEISKFCEQPEVITRYSHLNPGDLGRKLKMEMDICGKDNNPTYGVAKFILLHTFSHLIMKELEFSCGYPTASLQERLYFSKRMCGVLIYTAEGSEGSMGGLVSQGSPIIIEGIIKNAMLSALDCSSDPLCWEHADQLNLASCFSCTMVSETSCEQWNMGLDRRALVDEKFGFFKDLI